MRLLQIQSTTGQDPHYRALVADAGEVAPIAGVCGRAAELGRDLIQQANIRAQPQIVLRVLRSASA